jgi:cytochrome c-type biogenesis protein CcmF
MVAGDKVTVADYEFEFKGVQKVQGANYTADQGQVIVRDGDNIIATLNPEKRHYSVKNNMMTEADIDQGVFRDLYVAMGEPLDGDAWAVRVHYKPFVRWLWYGGTLMALGGLVTVTDKRYRRKKSTPTTDEASHA